MSDELVSLSLHWCRRALVVSLELSLPLLAVGLVIGLLISLFQALTQLQEQTIAFVPKILAMGATLFILLPWMLMVILDYTREMLLEMRTGLAP